MKRKKKKKLEWKEAVAQLQAVVASYEKYGVRMQIQFSLKGQMTSIGNMQVAEALGALDVARAIITNGLQADNRFDAFVQAIEHRPDLVRRLVTSMDKERRLE